MSAVRRVEAVVAVVALLAAAGCGDGDSGAPSGTATTPGVTTAPATSQDVDTRADDAFPDIVGATATYDEQSGTWTFAVTVSSPYDTPERYADGWRVMSPDGEVLGVHTLAHDHANEQPFTRRQTGVVVPDDVERVVVEGRDQANGFGGATVTVELGER